MAQPHSNPSEAARRLTALRLTDPKRWQRELESAFAGGASIGDAAAALGVSRLTAQRNVLALEEQTGRKLERPRSGRKDELAAPSKGAKRARAAGVR